MNVANLDLCKELYELSGWASTDQWLLVNEYGEQSVVQNKAIHNPSYPAYDLGYLIRKLPEQVHVYASNNNWFAVWNKRYKPQFYAIADTPENALCKLAIELHKQGVLPPKQEQGE